MLIYCLLLLILAGLILSPYISVAIGRFVTLHKISKLCREKEISFKVMNAFYPFSPNKRDRFDFIMRIGNTVIPVKFFSATDRSSTLIIARTGKICIARAFGMPFSRDGRKRKKIIKKYGSIPTLKIEKNIIGQKFTRFPMILNEPSFAFVRRIDENGKNVDLYSTSARVGGCTFTDSSTLIDLICAYSSEEKLKMGSTGVTEKNKKIQND